MSTKKPVIISNNSGKGGVGKTFISGTVATALAARGKKVLLVDLDFAGPSTGDFIYSIHNPDRTTNKPRQMRPVSDFNELGELLKEYKSNDELKQSFKFVDEKNGVIEYEPSVELNLNYIDSVLDQLVELKKRKYKSSYETILSHKYNKTPGSLEAAIKKYNDEISPILIKLDEMGHEKNGTPEYEKLKSTKDVSSLEKKVLEKMKAEALNGDINLVRDERVKELIKEQYMIEFTSKYKASGKSMFNQIFANFYAMLPRNGENVEMVNAGTRHPEFVQFLMDEIKNSDFDYVLLDFGAGCRETDLEPAIEADHKLLVYNADLASPSQSANILWQFAHVLSSKYEKSKDSSLREIANAFENVQSMEEFLTYFDNYVPKVNQEKVNQITQKIIDSSKSGENIQGLLADLEVARKEDSINLPLVLKEMEKIRNSLNNTIHIVNNVGINEVQQALYNARMTPAYIMLNYGLNSLLPTADGRIARYEGDNVFNLKNCDNKNDVDIISKIASYRITYPKDRIILTHPDMKKTILGEEYYHITIDRTAGKIVPKTRISDFKGNMLLFKAAQTIYAIADYIINESNLREAK
ncbi:MAG: P-loop NTPase [Candidatus Woesearchaeota archaeon]|jgi:septum formation inhibitor-activating ATPase MinD